MSNPTPTVDPEDLAVLPEEQAFINLLNDYRASTGLSRLGIHSALNRVAAWHAQDMETRGYFSHNPPDESWASMMQRFQVPGTWGENIGWGYQTPAALLAGFKNSPLHDQNQLRPQWRSIGVAKEGEDWPYWVVNFSTVEPDGGVSPPPPPPAPVTDVFVEEWDGATGFWRVRRIDLPDPPPGESRWYIIKALKGGQIVPLTAFVREGPP